MGTKFHTQRNPDDSNLVGESRFLVSEEAIRIGGDRREFNRWLVDQRRTNKNTILEEMAEILTPMFQFLADGYATGNLETRAWALLYAVRPDLLGGETMKQYAEFRGVNHFAIQDTLSKLLREIPALKLDLSTRGYENGSLPSRREKLSKHRVEVIEKARKRIVDLRQRGLNAKKCAETKAKAKAERLAKEAAS